MGDAGVVVLLCVVDVIFGVEFYVSVRQLLPSLVMGVVNIGAAGGAVAVAVAFAGLGELKAGDNTAVPTKLKMAILYPMLLLAGSMLFVSLDCATLDVTIKPLNI